MATHPKRMNGCEAGVPGFTMIEVIVSTALMSVILSAGYFCFLSGTASQKIIESRREMIQSARVAMAIISADLRSAYPLSKEKDLVGMDRILDGIHADNIDFATLNYQPRAPGEGDFCEVSYFVRKEEVSGSFSLCRRRDPGLDPEPFSGGEVDVIARGIEGLQLTYYDGFEWFDEWGDPRNTKRGEITWLDPNNLSGMPEAVQITIKLVPDADPSRDANLDQGSDEPALVFETVARLDLVGMSSRAELEDEESGGGAL
jgi:prepilin-type N-terminal cleavage/methylation domain-containing protein